MGYVEVAGVGHVLPDGRVLLADAAFRVGDGVKAALVRAALDPILSPPPAPPPPSTAPLTYGSFYAGGATFTGRYGRFPRA